MIQKVMVLTPPGRALTGKNVGSMETFPHNGLGYIAAYLKNAGYEVRFLDAMELGLDLDTVMERIAAFAPDLVGVSALTVQVKQANRLAVALKQRWPAIVTVLGGYHASAIPLETAKEFPSFDFVVVGEGELAILSIIDAVNTGDLGKVRSAIYRDSQGEIRQSPLAPILDVDAGPMPAWEEFDLTLYHGLQSDLPKVVPVAIAASRGCPYSCVFCFKSMGSLVRDRSIESVIEEMRIDIERFGATQIVFTDETFTLRRERTLTLCKRIVEEGFQKRIKWICESRVDFVDEELFFKMAEAGCESVSFGVETGNAEILKIMNKKSTLDQARMAFKAAHRAGIKTRANMILGLPGESEATLRDSIDFTMELKPYSVCYSIISPYPGTKVYEWATKGEHGLRLISNDWEGFGRQIGNALEHDGLPRATLEKYQRLGYRKFYLHPFRIWRLIEIIKLRSIPTYILHNIRSAVRSMFRR